MVAGQPVVVAAHAGVRVLDQMEVKDRRPTAGAAEDRAEPVKVEMVDAAQLKKLRANDTGKVVW